MQTASTATEVSPTVDEVSPTVDEKKYTPAELEFMTAMQAHKKRTGRLFPTWKEVLEVLQGLGYTRQEAA